MFFAKEAFKKLAGGDLYVAALPAYSEQILNRDLLGNVLSSALEYEARGHGARFRRAGFSQVLKALASRKITAIFFAAAWDLCHQIPMGVQVLFPGLDVIRIKSDLLVRRIYHTEDFSFAENSRRNLIAAKPKHFSFPADFGLAKYCDLECMRFMVQKMASGRTGEIDPKNVPIRRVIEPYGAVIGEAPASGIFNFSSLPSTMQSTWHPEIVARHVPLPDGGHDGDNFYTSWASRCGRSQLVSTYTKVTSTFTGNPVIKCNIATNNHVSESMLQSVLPSAIAAGSQKISDLKWGLADGPLKQSVSPSIPILGTRAEQYRALLNANIEELTTNKGCHDDVSRCFGGPPVETHFTLFDEPDIVFALNRNGVASRKIGERSSQPAKIDFADLAKLISDFPTPKGILFDPFDKKEMPNKVSFG